MFIDKCSNFRIIDNLRLLRINSLGVSKISLKSPFQIKRSTKIKITHIFSLLPSWKKKLHAPKRKSEIGREKKTIERGCRRQDLIGISYRFHFADRQHFSGFSLIFFSSFFFYTYFSFFSHGISQFSSFSIFKLIPFRLIIFLSFTWRNMGRARKWKRKTSNE